MKLQAFVLGLFLVGCVEDPSVCIDVIEEADLEQYELEIYVEPDFLGTEACFEGVSRKTCKEKGGYTVSLAEYESADTPLADACGQQGLSVQCGNVAFVAAEAECPEGYVIVVHE